MSSAPIRTGIIGLGRSGWSNHAQAMGRLPGFALTAVADHLAERRAEAEQKFGCTAYTAYPELLADPRIELAVVCTPSHTHAEIAIAACAAGKHVLVEKPMATSVAEADAMMAAAAAHGTLLTVFQNRRLDPDFLRVQDILASDVLGPAHLIRMGRYGFQRRNDWQTLTRLGGGLLNNWGAHILDQGLLLLGGTYTEIFADLRRTVSAGDAEDHVKVLLRGPQGPTLDVEITTACATPGPEWLIMGERGTLSGSEKRLEWKYYPEGALPALVADPGPAAGRRYGTGEVIPWQTAQEDIPHVDTTAAFYGRLADSIRGGAPLLVTGESVRRQIALLADIRRAGGV